MKARLPQSAQPQNYNKMMKQVQQIQEDMQKAQAVLDEKSYVGAAGGGKVEITVTGKKEVTGVRIDPSVIDPDDAEFLQDMVAAAVNDAIRAVDADSSATMSQIAGPMGAGLGL